MKIKTLDFYLLPIGYYFKMDKKIYKKKDEDTAVLKRGRKKIFVWPQTTCRLVKPVSIEKIIKDNPHYEYTNREQ